MRCSRCGCENPPQNYYCRSCGAVLQSGGYVEATIYEQETGTGGTIKMILIGLGIGLGVLGIVFSIILFFNRGSDEDMTATATAPTTVAATTESTESYRDDDQWEDHDYDSYDRNDTYDKYSAYRTEAQLYSYDAPEILPEASSRYIDSSDLAGLNDDQIQKAINDIYARNGLIFKNDRFSDYYYSQRWYYPQSDIEDEIRINMNDYELRNVDTMKDYTER